jgi:hypothetical protein
MRNIVVGQVPDLLSSVSNRPLRATQAASEANQFIPNNISCHRSRPCIFDMWPRRPTRQTFESVTMSANPMGVAQKYRPITR